MTAQRGTRHLPRRTELGNNQVDAKDEGPRAIGYAIATKEDGLETIASLLGKNAQKRESSKAVIWPSLVERQYLWKQHSPIGIFRRKLYKLCLGATSRFESRTVVVPKNRPESRTSVSSRTEIDTFSFAPSNPKPVVAYYGSDPNSTKECASSWEYKAYPSEFHSQAQLPVSTTRSVPTTRKDGDTALLANVGCVRDSREAFYESIKLIERKKREWELTGCKRTVSTKPPPRKAKHVEDGGAAHAGNTENAREAFYQGIKGLECEKRELELTGAKNTVTEKKCCKRPTTTAEPSRFYTGRRECTWAILVWYLTGAFQRLALGGWKPWTQNLTWIEGPLNQIQGERRHIVEWFAFGVAGQWRVWLSWEWHS
ncbi:hypothetical protein B0H16DRAFT_1487342 [Mycena metata]|uniref:Uncharacterized protein n=1 Tax=Mycena metata TaxID=1033252 RepID=A0AAD7DD24_9AGAR|nr:hypothetical protein B0H16DRAFT_1487342 [Mycena metata]